MQFIRIYILVEYFPFIKLTKFHYFININKWKVFNENVDFDKLNDYTMLYVEKSFFFTSGMILFHKKYSMIYKGVWDMIKDEKMKKEIKYLHTKNPAKLTMSITERFTNN